MLNSHIHSTITDPKGSHKYFASNESEQEQQ